jgi:hypothetical protein
MSISGMLATLVALQGVPAIAPKPAPPVFVTSIYGLTFKTPPASFYCPLPDDWVGSDHGTTVFLQSPGSCGGAGFPSSSRGFSRNVPRIDVFYAYWMGEDEPSPPPCPAAGRMQLFSELRPLCREDKDGWITVTVSARYTADIPAQVTVTLVTQPNRLDQDISKLISLTTSMRSCSSVWTFDKGKRSVVGNGPRCPKDGEYF